MDGQDKPFLDVGGVPILARVIASLRSDGHAIAISANGDPARFAGFELPVLPDGQFRGEGPLAGVLAGLDWAATLGADALLTVPGDTPFVPRRPRRRSRATARLRGEQWPGAPPGRAVAGRLPRRLAPGAVGAGTPRHRSLRRRIGMRRVDFAVAKWDPFLNVNTPEDLAAARAIAEGET